MSDSQGVLFPLDEHGERSTLRTNQAAWADAARAADADLAGRIEASERWRADYLVNVRAVTELGARPADAATRVGAGRRPAGRRRVHGPPCYHGAKYVGMEIFAPDTMRTVMSALMVHDLHNPPTDRQPERRIAHGAVHGGYWRRHYEIRSTLMYTAALGLPNAYAPVLRIR